MGGTTKAILRYLVILVAIFSIAACGGGAAPPTPTPTAIPLNVPPKTMLIKDGVFHPKELTVKLGDTVTFINMDDRIYIMRDGKYGPDFTRGGFGKDQKWEFTFQKSGDFDIGDFRFDDLRGIVHVIP